MKLYECESWWCNIINESIHLFKDIKWKVLFSTDLRLSSQNIFIDEDNVGLHSFSANLSLILSIVLW